MPTTRRIPKPVVLVIRDGWGMSEEPRGNAILAAGTPRLDALLKRYPFTFVEASGDAVGLPRGQMGSSEIGHLNIGTGRIVYQGITAIDHDIETGGFQKNPVVLGAIRTPRDRGGSLHLFGLLSDGGVHSHIDHLFAILDMCRAEGMKRVFVHAFLDGRDTPPTSGLEYVRSLERKIESLGFGAIATVMGRFYAMDRDKRWDRVEVAWRAIALGEGRLSDSATGLLEACYASEETDEFVIPTVIRRNPPYPGMTSNDAIFFYNFRADRAREISRSFVLKGAAFDGFARPKEILPYFAAMAPYEEDLPIPAAIKSEPLREMVGEIVARSGKRQLRIAETEKYAHVTFFFNGGEEKTYEGEDRVLVPSPKVATYDLKPEMSALEVTAEAVKRIESGRYDLIVLNFANADMVGHTGIWEASLKAVRVVDDCVGRIVEATPRAGGAALVTADHGNAEKMVDLRTLDPFTAHTVNPVHLILADDARLGAKMRPGRLSDLGPTVLDLMGLKSPGAMSGRSLVEG
ncbi:MAG: 2,3-bisphosphoglycerate-independent phosphoglycerate mutase [Planctomycetota bacterium]